MFSVCLQTLSPEALLVHILRLHERRILQGSLGGSGSKTIALVLWHLLEMPRIEGVGVQGLGSGCTHPGLT